MKKVILLTAYLLLNILVSAAVTLLVMWWWQQNHPLTCEQELTGIPLINPTQPVEIQPESPDNLNTQATPTLPPLEEIVIRIDNVFGVGDPQMEEVVLERVGEGDLWLEDWRLLDQNGNQFIFPAIALRKGILQVYTRPGTSDLKSGLNWGLSEAVWQTGEYVTLVDPLGNIRAVYQIP